MYMYRYMYAYISIYIDIHIYVYVCIYLYICIYIYIYIHTYISIDVQSTVTLHMCRSGHTRAYISRTRAHVRIYHTQCRCAKKKCNPIQTTSTYCPALQHTMLVRVTHCNILKHTIPVCTRMRMDLLFLDLLIVNMDMYNHMFTYGELQLYVHT